MRKYLIAAAGLVALLTACAASGPRVTTNVDPAADFSAFKTYNLMRPLGTDRPGGFRTPLSNMLDDAVSLELERRGLQRSNSPDLLVNFFVNTEQRMDVRQTPTAGSFHGHRRNRYSTWGSYRTTVRQYTQGTLVIDLVDPKRNTLVWEGVAEGRLRRSDREITQERVDEVVGAILAELPL